jgi:hypothetical protein
MPAGQPRRGFGDRGRLCRSFHAENVGHDEGVAMETQVSRGLVVLLPRSASVPRLARKVPSRLGQRSPRIQLVEPADPAGDAATETEWGLLIRLAVEAWTKHTPESLDVLEQTVVRVRTMIARDWST